MRTPSLSRRQFIAGAVSTGAVVGIGGTVAVRHVTAQASAGNTPPEAEGVPRLVPTVCGMCDANCGVLAYVQGTRLYKLEGNRSHSHSRGHICPRGSAGVKLLYDPDRLQKPLKRTGDGQYVPISWEQAYAEIGQTLGRLRDQYGPQTLAYLRHADAADEWDRQFAAAFGTPNLFSQVAMARGSRDLACRATLGWIPVPDLDRTRFVLICGRNYGETIFPADLDALFAAKEAGAKIVVVDPRLTNTAAQAHEWLAIRPGTDGALLSGLMSVIVAEELYDKQFVERNVIGFRELRDYVADKTPSWAATETDIGAETIVRLAREMAAAKPAAFVDPSWHAAWGGLYDNSLNTARLALALNALLGAYGAAGGLAMPLADSAVGQFTPPATAPAAAPRVDGADKIDAALLPAGHGFPQALPEIILSGQPYPIKAMIVRHANPARSLPNSKKAIEALGKLELLVAIDVLPSDTTELAHYVLPEATFLERFDPPLASRGNPPEFAIRQPVVPPRYESKPASEIIAGLAAAVGIGDKLGFGVQDVMAAMLKPAGIDQALLALRGVWRDQNLSQPAEPRFATPSGKIEIRSDRLEQAGFDALPEYTRPLVQPEGGNSFRLLHGRGSYHTGTATQNNAWLNALQPDNALVINTARAARLGVSDGDTVVVQSDAGEVRVRARVTEGIHPQAVFLQHGFGARARGQRRAFGRGANDNDLVVDRPALAAATAAMCETIVRVAKA